MFEPADAELLDLKKFEKIFIQPKQKVEKFCQANDIFIISLEERPQAENLFQISMSDFISDNDIDTNTDKLLAWLKLKKPDCIAIFDTHFNKELNKSPVGCEVFIFHASGIFIWDIGYSHHAKYLIKNSTSFLANQSVSNKATAEDAYLSATQRYQQQALEWEVKDQIIDLAHEAKIIDLATPKKTGFKTFKKFVKDTQLIDQIKHHEDFIEPDFLDWAYDELLDRLAEYKTDELINKVKHQKEVLQGKNSNQRILLAKQLFDKDELVGISDAKLDSMMAAAKDYFEIEGLPRLVKTLADDGKTAKQVADAIGISLAKAKRLMAS